jgi:hypothetical protein
LTRASSGFGDDVVLPDARGTAAPGRAVHFVRFRSWRVDGEASKQRVEIVVAKIEEGSAGG